jgi:acyl-CoA thioester hydrolase
MLEHNTKVRVRYAETDRMGYVYYGNYAVYFEIARVEMLRELGLTYKSMEDNGIILPVLEFTIKYFKPAFYDDMLTIKTVIRKKPATRIFFEYETFNQSNILLNTAHVTLVFVSKLTGKPQLPSPEFNAVFSPYFKKSD